MIKWIIFAVIKIFWCQVQCFAMNNDDQRVRFTFTLLDAAIAKRKSRKSGKQKFAVNFFFLLVMVK
jgi:hypothetical protein